MNAEMTEKLMGIKGLSTRTCRARQGAPKDFARTGLHPITTGNDFPVSAIRDFRQFPSRRWRKLRIYIRFDENQKDSLILSCLMPANHLRISRAPLIWNFYIEAKDWDFQQFLSSLSVYLSMQWNLMKKVLVTHHPTKQRLRRDHLIPFCGGFQ